MTQAESTECACGEVMRGKASDAVIYGGWRHDGEEWMCGACATESNAGSPNNPEACYRPSDADISA